MDKRALPLVLPPQPPHQAEISIFKLSLPCLSPRALPSFGGMSATVANIFTCSVTLGNAELVQAGETKPSSKGPQQRFYFASKAAAASIPSQLCTLP